MRSTALTALVALRAAAVAYESDGSYVPLLWDTRSNLTLSSDYAEVGVADVDSCAERCLEIDGCVHFSTKNIGNIEEVVYTSGTTAQASNAGTIDGVLAGISYDIEARILFWCGLWLTFHLTGGGAAQ